MIPSRDQTGVPRHFHSSTAAGSAFRISARMRPSVSPRQSPSLRIRRSMRHEAASPLAYPRRFAAARFPRDKIALLSRCAGSLSVADRHGIPNRPEPARKRRGCAERRDAMGALAGGYRASGSVRQAAIK
jgi:hypothetical protein